MELRIPNDSEYREYLGDLSNDATLADLLRAEVTARGSCTRAAAVGRLQRALAGLVPEDTLRGRLSDLCRTLEADGDFSVSKGGFLHVSPVRAVVLDQTTHRVVSSLPTRVLGPQLPGSLQVEGTCRTHHLAPDRTDDLTLALEALGGVALTVDAWAGLERGPPADAAWMDNLAQRLQWHAESQGSLERDGALDWATLEFTDEGPRWRRRSDAPTRLWRARSPNGRWLFAWSASDQTPAGSDFVSLSDDDAARTVFAVARTEERPVQARIEHHGEERRLFIREWLPRAEYRFLAALGACEFIDRETVWSFVATRQEQVVSMLSERLGVGIKTVVAE
ncbi:MAG: hypothetical protein H6739_06310 [Alphaproteobacteria bacterium]|nr:hypothetical protein [Alphaproteobacteria bacterium]